LGERYSTRARANLEQRGWVCLAYYREPKRSTAELRFTLRRGHLHGGSGLPKKSRNIRQTRGLSDQLPGRGSITSIAPEKLPRRQPFGLQASRPPPTQTTPLCFRDEGSMYIRTRVSTACTSRGEGCDAACLPAIFELLRRL